MIYKQKLITLMTIFSLMSVSWGESTTDNYTQERVKISDDEVMIISNHEIEGYTYSDTSYISVSRLLPPCDEGYTEIDSSCYYQSDLDVIQIFIDNSDSISIDVDINNNGIIEPLELGNQDWDFGRLTNLTIWSGGVFIFPTQIPLTVGNLSELESLRLRINSVTGTIPESIGDLLNLKYLDFHLNNYNGLSGEIPESMCNLTNLIYTNIGFNSLSGNIPECIVNLTNLQNLSYNNNNLTGSLPENIGDMTSLRTLWLNGNLLSGNIPESIGNLSNIRHIYISDNLIGGVIPESISNLSLLSTFNISNNLIGGVIPESICDLENLDFIGDSNSNWIFNISYNQLCPSYPECIEDFVGEQDTSECVEYSLGDCTQDGEIDVVDVILLIGYIVGNSEMSESQIELSDMNDDGNIDVVDVIELIYLIINS